MSPAKTVTERVQKLRIKADSLGLKRRDLYAHPEDWPAIKALRFFCVPLAPTARRVLCGRIQSMELGRRQLNEMILFSQLGTDMTDHNMFHRRNTMNADQTLTLARKHLATAIQESSARFCMEDAVKALDAGYFDRAKMWAVKSLGYSVGIFHADYKRAAV